MTIGKWDLAGVHGLRQYIWYLLQEELEWTAENYGGLVPIVTPEQQPEMTAFNKPFIVYAYSKKMGSNNYFLESEVASFTIFSQSEKDIRQVLNLLDTKFDKRDEAAYELNEFISQSSLDVQYKYFDYKTIWVSAFQGPAPESEEGGRRDGVININVTYTHYGPDGAPVRV